MPTGDGSLTNTIWTFGFRARPLGMASLSPPSFHWLRFDAAAWLSWSRPDGATHKPSESC